MNEMMNSENSITLNSKTYTEAQLADTCFLKLTSPSTQTWEFNLYKFILQWKISNNNFIKVKTSGSTGNPKEISISKKAMTASAKLTGDYLDLKRGDKALLCLPLDFISGKMMVIRTLVLGLNLIPVEPIGNPLKNKNEDFDFAAMTPMQIHNILEDEKGIEKLDKIKNLIIGGGEINPQLESKLSKLKNNTFHTYGMTETATHIAMKKINGTDKNKYFVALQNVWFEQDNRNCLVIFAPHISNDCIITNDIVILKNKTEFEFIGRYDNTINSGGIKINPEIIEKKIESFINRRFFIYGKPDAKLVKKIILIVEGKPNKQIEKTLENIPFSKFEKPKEIVFISQFKETENGKVNREFTVQYRSNIIE